MSDERYVQVIRRRIAQLRHMLKQSIGDATDNATELEALRYALGCIEYRRAIGAQLADVRRQQEVDDAQSELS